MEAVDRTANEQSILWNGIAGRAWVESQDLLDRMLKPFEDLLIHAVVRNEKHAHSRSRTPPLAPPTRGGEGFSGHPELVEGRRRVLDVGCGTGSTTVAIARTLPSGGSCTGVDISEPMVAAARARAEREAGPADFVQADAQEFAFEAASFDMIVSRFGVMFFDDPVRAFANLRRAARIDAELKFIVWRNAAENPFMTTAERAAAPLLPNIPSRLPDAPGQFAFADARRMQRILEGSGWAATDIQPVDIACVLPAKDLVAYLTKLGPLGRVLPEVDEQTRTRVIETVRAAFDPYVHGDEVRFNAACWIVGASRGN